MCTCTRTEASLITHDGTWSYQWISFLAHMDVHRNGMQIMYMWVMVIDAPFHPVQAWTLTAAAALELLDHHHQNTEQMLLWIATAIFTADNAIKTAKWRCDEYNGSPQCHRHSQPANPTKVTRKVIMDRGNNSHKNNVAIKMTMQWIIMDRRKDHIQNAAKPIQKNQWIVIMDHHSHQMTKGIVKYLITCFVMCV